MFSMKVSPVLAEGCTMVVKPAEQTPLSALFYAHLAKKVKQPFSDTLFFAFTFQVCEIGKKDNVEFSSRTQYQTQLSHSFSLKSFLISQVRTATSVFL